MPSEHSRPIDAAFARPTTETSSSIGADPVTRGVPATSNNMLLALRRSPDLAALYACVLVLPLMLVLPVAPVRVPLGIILVLFVPGYAMTGALFSRNDNVRGVTRLALSFGLSIVSLPPLALALDLSGALIHPQPTLFALSAWTLLWTTVAFWRRYRHRTTPDLGDSFEANRARTAKLALRQNAGIVWFLAVLAAAILLVLFALPLTGTQSEATEFYMLGNQGEARDYPRAVRVGEPVSVTVGIVNEEARTHSYRIEVWSHDQVNTDVADRLTSFGPITVESRHAHEQTITWEIQDAGEHTVVTLLLYREHDGIPHRRLHFTLDVDPIDRASSTHVPPEAS